MSVRSFFLYIRHIHPSVKPVLGFTPWSLMSLNTMVSILTRSKVFWLVQLCVVESSCMVFRVFQSSYGQASRPVAVLFLVRQRAFSTWACIICQFIVVLVGSSSFWVMGISFSMLSRCRSYSSWFGPGKSKAKGA
jgi:hypothetical protein